MFLCSQRHSSVSECYTIFNIANIQAVFAKGLNRLFNCWYDNRSCGDN